MLTALRTALTAALLILTGAPPAAGQAYPAYTYGEHDGLPSGVVFGIAQDSTGLMWFATRAGIVSFDGQTWEIEAPLGPTGMPTAHLVFDWRDTFWGTSMSLQAGLLRREAGGDWNRIPAPGPGANWRVMNLTPLSQGDRHGVLVATRTDGVHLWWPDGWESVELPAPVLEANLLECIPLGDDLALATSRGCWIRKDGAWSTIELPDSLDPLVCSLAPCGPPAPGEPGADDGSLQSFWLVGRDWFGLYERDTLTDVQPHRLFTDEQHFYHDDSGALASLADGRDGLWFGNRNRLAHYDRTSDELRPQGVFTGLAANGATALFRDIDQNTWVATYRGVSRVTGQRFVNYDRSAGLLADEVCSIIEHPDGYLIFGQPGGLSYLDLRTGEVSNLPLPLSTSVAQSTPVIDLSLDEDGQVWGAAAQLGIIRVSRSGDIVRIGSPHGTYRANSVHVDHEGTVWAASARQLYRVEDDQLEQPVGLPTDQGVRRVKTLRDGTLALVTQSQGVWVETARGWEHLEGPAPGVASQTYAAYCDREGRLLVGALDGLFVREGDQLVPLPLGGETISDPVYSINQDRDGCYWIGTQLGLIAWNGQTLRRYGVHEGLAGLETNRAANLLDSSGTMWFGTVKGASRYSPVHDIAVDRPPSVTLLGVELEGELQPLCAAGERLEVGRTSNDPAFHFRAISFLGAGEVEYRCRLDGYDSDWIRPGAIEGVTARASGGGYVRYTNLAPGDYQLHVQARTPGGRWGRASSSDMLRILPPLWMTPWFALLATAVLLALGYGLWRFIYERRYTLELKRQVDERTADLVRSQKLESLGLLAGGVAHDFNNLLTAMMAHCELARLDPHNAEAHLDSIDGAAERGAMLTKALLGYARRQDTRPRVLRLNESMAKVEALVRPVIRAEIEVQTRLAADLAPVNLDPGQLEQVLMNLVVNASDAMPSGGVLKIATDNVTLNAPKTIAHEETLSPGRWVRLTISDTGVGMDETTSSLLFDPFFTTKSGGRGTGLGLSTCHGIVKQNGGFIDFTTALGSGTTFHVYFPAVEGIPIHQSPAQARPQTAGLLDAWVLVAEDDAMVRPMISEALKRTGCRVLLADSAEAALELAQHHEHPIDLLISDVIMPGLSGPELRERLLEQRPGIRALFISGYTADVLDDHDLSTVELLPKPFSIEELAKRASLLLASRSNRFSATRPG